MTTLRQQLNRAQGDFMSLTIPQLIGVFWRRKWIIGTILFIALCTAVIANGVITPRYTATATVIVEPRQQNVIEIESVMSSLPVSLETMQSEVQIIQSPTLARQVIDGLGLAALAEFNPSLLPRERSVVDELKSGVKGLFRPGYRLAEGGTGAAPAGRACRGPGHLGSEHRASAAGLGTDEDREPLPGPA